MAYHLSDVHHTHSCCGQTFVRIVVTASSDIFESVSKCGSQIMGTLDLNKWACIPAPVFSLI